MTPEGRVAAAIDVLDDWLAGARADRALTSWGRAHRFAGSKDRAAIRDLVFEAIRCKRSFAALGGAETGRGLMLGRLRASGVAPESIFGVGRFGPAAISDADPDGHPPSGAAALDAPDWLAPKVQASLHDAADGFWRANQTRAPVFLRARDRDRAAAALLAEGIGCTPHPEVGTALEVTENPRRVAGSQAMQNGEVELQDAHSQDSVLTLPPAKRILDYCAGAGGKALALSARYDAPVVAHDVSLARMEALPDRARRAKADITRCLTKDLPKAAFDMVFCDAPCSGSGTWRRDPEGKWRLTEQDLEEVQQAQREVLTAASAHMTPEATLVYVTCSVLEDENEAQVRWAEEALPHLSCIETRRWPVGPSGDGFFRAVFRSAAT